MTFGLIGFGQFFQRLFDQGELGFGAAEVEQARRFVEGEAAGGGLIIFIGSLKGEGEAGEDVFQSELADLTADVENRLLHTAGVHRLFFLLLFVTVFFRRHGSIVDLFEFGGVVGD